MILTFPSGLIGRRGCCGDGARRMGRTYGIGCSPLLMSALLSVRSPKCCSSASNSYVSKALSRRARTGETTARPQRCHVPPKLASLYEAIREQVASTPDMTLEELKVWLSETHGTEASTTLIWETLDKLDLTLKKRPCTPPNRIDPMSCARVWPGGENAGRQS